MASEAKPTTMRLTDEARVKFKDIAAQMGGNQDAALARLMECWERQGVKGALPDYAAQIETFDGHVSAISAAYTDVCKQAADAYERAKGEFRAQLDSKDSVIAELQQQLDKARQESAAAADTAAKATADLAGAQATVAELQQQLQDAKAANERNTQLLTALDPATFKANVAAAVEEAMKQRKQEQRPATGAAAATPPAQKPDDTAAKATAKAKPKAAAKKPAKK